MTNEAEKAKAWKKQNNKKKKVSALTEITFVDHDFTPSQQSRLLHCIEEMIHWEITQPMIGHKFIMLLEEVSTWNAFTRRRAEFLRYLCPDVTSIVHHLGLGLIWKEHLPDLLMNAPQLNLIHILYFAAVSRMFSRCFMAILCKTNSNAE